jgi:hypothetical protein
LENKRGKPLKYKPTKPGALKVASFLLFFGALGYAGYLYQTKYISNQAPPVRERKKPALIKINISGEIKYPGQYSLPPGSRVADLIEKSGGLTPKADRDQIDFIARLKNGQNIEIPRKKGFFSRLGIGKGPEETYVKPPIEVIEEK